MFKDVAEAKFLPFEFIPRWVSLAALNRIFCQYRGYYMAARRYEISLRVLKNISTREEKFRISKRPCNVLFIT